MGTVLNVHLNDQQMSRLEQAATAMQQPTVEAATRLLEEALRQQEFPWIEFRNSGYGRQAFLQGTRLAVWHVVVVARALNFDVDQIAEYFPIPAFQVTALLNYAASFPDEIQAAIDDDHNVTEERLREWAPNLEIIRA